ncbi:MAG: phosphodiester glycosidase family protein [Paracoccaceae bacterium]
MRRGGLLGAFVVCVVSLVWAASAGWAVTCNTRSHDGARYAICEVDLTRDDLRLFLYDDTFRPYGHFSTLNDALFDQGKRLTFAMNGGMYHNDRAPVGHYVENGTELMRVIPTPGPGNFGLLPNGIFCIQDGRARVQETLAFVRDDPDCRFATQSGPMLVIDGALHPRFLPNSTSRHIRNGVGVSDDGTRAYFAISSDVVTFHEFGRLFRDALAVDNALFLDGRVSRLYAPQIGRSDFGRWMGPILGVVAPFH